METQTFPSGFSKREFVVTTEGERFPQDIALGCLKEKAAMLDEFKPGQKVKVSFDISGREYNERYFVNLNAWRIESLDEQNSSAAPDSVPEQFEEVDDVFGGEEPF
jgi:hypothetical protein